MFFDYDPLPVIFFLSLLGTVLVTARVCELIHMREMRKMKAEEANKALNAAFPIASEDVSTSVTTVMVSEHLDSSSDSDSTSTKRRNTISIPSFESPTTPKRSTNTKNPLKSQFGFLYSNSTVKLESPTNDKRARSSSFTRRMSISFISFKQKVNSSPESTPSPAPPSQSARKSAPAFTRFTIQISKINFTGRLSRNIGAFKSGSSKSQNPTPPPSPPVTSTTQSSASLGPRDRRSKCEHVYDRS